ncbi:type II secretion system protein [Fontivita pretiosa]|uniref:type II secretion system protein n=1 Tax=Fontivita pretiosa TaxID=2989684 RepID=UPI003D165FD4
MCVRRAPDASRSHGSPPAFTLVELLVVIGIIAVLISILIPTLGKARAASTRTVCLSNLRQLASACVLYATENRGSIPPNNGPSLNQSQTWEVWFDPKTTGGVRPARDGYIENWSGIGILFVRRYIREPTAFYCPGQVIPLLTYPTGWEHDKRQPIGYKAIGYIYRIFGQAQPPHISVQDVKAIQGMKLGKMKGTRALAMDAIGQNDWAPKSAWPHRNQYGICVGYSDGHANFQLMNESDYKHTFQIRNARMGDIYIFRMFKAMDTLDFTEVRQPIPTN